MPDEEQPEPLADGNGGSTDESPTDTAASHPAPGEESEMPGGRVFSSYGLVSAFLGLVAIAAVVFGFITWSMHHGDADDRAYRSRVLQAAAGWTSVLINLNAENVERGMQRMHDKTVGQLNGEFDAVMQPYRDVVQQIQSRSTGRIEAVAVESVYHDLDNPSGSGSHQSSSAVGRTEPVLVIATSIAENVGGKPQTVHWALHLDVSEVDGRMLISRMRSIR